MYFFTKTIGFLDEYSSLSPESLPMQASMELANFGSLDPDKYISASDSPSVAEDDALAFISIQSYQKF
ncbi:hypothetical protein AYI70_g2470 [Smittium culicis]|uniref:Uncharacterized protein n=1 Tax=Smittium culicis TaxID=133412 RepID=A0A1R1Y803_9FUNG|nr:hypothetical protein AYI70_g2470 [Smittium culicis]